MDTTDKPRKLVDRARRLQRELDAERVRRLHGRHKLDAAELEAEAEPDAELAEPPAEAEPDAELDEPPDAELDEPPPPTLTPGEQT